MSDKIDWTKTYYMSGPMSGYENFNYGTFEDAETALISVGLKIESPHRNPWPDGHENLPPEVLWQEMMNLALHQMDKCQGLILLKGWPQSRGCRAELTVAMDRDWPIYYYHDFALHSMNKEGVL